MIDRTPSGRFVRNLALSLSGGALLTLIGAGIAQADEAATASEGLGSAGTGDATAVGNRSGTTANQGTGASTGTGNIQIINQNAGVANVGVAVANTGGNIAVGNASSSSATADQTADGGVDGIGVNSGSASNASDGRAFIQTGSAYAVGNESSTTLDQRADGTAHGTLGGVLVLSQNALVVNAGLGVSNTGLNGAVGNASGNPLNPLGGAPNTAGLLQTATSGSAGGGANNSGTASNATNGKATISTGNASSIGNRADTKVSQVAGSGDGDPEDSGLSVITQLGGALNAGAAVSNTGLNGAVGNASSNTAVVGGPDPFADPQSADATFTGVGYANNSGSATNAADGTAWITTGDADAIGNDSRTAIVQEAQAEFGDGGVVNVQTQLAPVVNLGLGVANSGVNGAVGNVSGNTAALSQTAFGTDAGDDSLFNVVTNQGEAANASDGTAEIHTGDAHAQGNWSDTTVSQWTEATGDALAVQTQAELVANVGIGVANSGVNGAVGNASQNGVATIQDAAFEPLDTDPFGLGQSTVSNSGSASNDSDGTATIRTGDASASGNEATTHVHQTIDPTGVSIQTQAAVVANLGLGVSNSGVNGAVGNISDNAPGDGAILDQDAFAGDGSISAGIVTVANQGEATNSSDGTASISTGDASSVGNHSDSRVTQVANATSDALGVVVNTQVGGVVNAGAGVANSGLNGAVGNSSSNRAEGAQTTSVIGDPVLTGVLTASNSASVGNSSDGTASITTGDASARGNDSVTTFSQTADGHVAGLGIAVNTQAGGVVNAGAGIANSGANIALGNDADSEAFLSQVNLIGADETDLVAGLTVTATNSGEASNASRGTGEIHTGDAEALGNKSDTTFTQNLDGNVDGTGAVVNTQLGGVANLGLGVANSGVNAALGNVSDNNSGIAVGDGGLDQLSEVGTADDSSIVAILAPITSSNAGSSSNSSDGLGSIRTGDAQAQGNVSTTAFDQSATGTIGADGMGVVPNVQVGGVLNLGVGVANSGINGAVGNASGLIPSPLGAIVAPVNSAGLVQESLIDSDPTGLFPDIDGAAGGGVTAFGPITSTNSGEVGNATDGTGKVVTGGALATGNVSTTNFSQNVRGTVDGLGLVVGPQIGGVANIGVGVANSGINGAVGNLSNSTAASGQSAFFGNDAELTVVGPLTVGNNGSTTNASDGDTCVCTGNAVATGNVSTSTLSQDLEIGVDDGLSVVPMTGVILNAGFGIANSGVNGAIGNISQNLATSEQTLELDPLYDPDPLVDGALVGPQTFVNGGGADNASDGTGKVGTGNARADGNISTSDLIQGVAVDGAGAFAAVNGGIGNVGLGVANSGVNAGIGNASTNVADLDQDAEGTGTVTNQGRASNTSDGFGGVGDPNCDVPGEGEPTPEEPGVPTLPKTGGPLEIEAAIGLMMLLAGFGFRRAARAAAARA